MAKVISKQKKIVKKSQNVQWNFPLNRTNLKYFGIGVAAILLGYALLATGLGGEYAAVEGQRWNNPMVIIGAPIVLVLGYCVIVPYSIFKIFKPENEDNSVE